MKIKTYPTPTLKCGHVQTRMHKAKTEKKCACCHQTIEIETLYIKRVGVFRGKFYSSHFHYSCHRWYVNSLKSLLNPYGDVRAS